MADSKKTEAQATIKATVKIDNPKFTKRALVANKEFSPIERDVLKLALNDDKEYTIAEVKEAVEKFKEGY